MLIGVFQIKSPSTIFKYIEFTIISKALTPEEKSLLLDRFWVDLRYFYSLE